MPEPPLPPVLYKYFPAPEATKFSQENLEKVLREGLIRLTSAKEVNDPYENEPHLVDNLKVQDIYDNFVSIWEADYGDDPYMAEQQEKFKAQFPTKLSIQKSKGKLYREHHDFLAEVVSDSFRKFGFYCLTEVRNSQLMWAHYASSHTGICLGFDSSNRLFPNLSRPVAYSDNRVSVEMSVFVGHHDKLIPGDIIRKVHGTKCKDWEYEKEWRFFGVHPHKDIIGRVGQVVDFKRNAIVEIIFGVRTSEKQKILSNPLLVILCRVPYIIKHLSLRAPTKSKSNNRISKIKNRCNP